MPDRLQEIRARLDAATTLPASPNSVTLFPLDRRRDEKAERVFIAHAPGDIAWLLDRVEMERRMNTDDDLINELRDQVNAMWDVIWEVHTRKYTKDEIAELVAVRLEVHRKLRRPGMPKVKGASVLADDLTRGENK